MSARKSDEVRRTARVNVPLTEGEVDALRRVADRQTRSVAFVAREYLLAGLKRERAK